ncbi:MAG: TIGR03086 family metal-binding protein [Actinomycetota bacterium]
MTDQIADKMSGQMTHDQLLERLDVVHRNGRRLVAGVAADQWRRPTPCSEWDVRQLVNHMAFTATLLGDGARRQEPSVAGIDDLLGDDPMAAIDQAFRRNAEAWQLDGALDGMVSVPAEMPAIAACTINLLDLGIHGWDLAQATGQDHGLTDDLVAVIDAADRQIVTDEVRERAGFGAALEPVDDRPLTAMLAFVGRSA